MKLNQGLTLLPCGPGVCQECATHHDPAHPHNQQSLYWQYKFYGAHGRWPKWEDAMAHCSAEMKAWWIDELAKHGVVVEQSATA